MIDFANLPMPPVIPGDHFATAARALVDHANDLIVTYSDETQTGAIYMGSKWSQFSPVTLAEFILFLQDTGVPITMHPDYNRWFAAVCAQSDRPQIN